jgi:hypothetical protein
MRTRNTSSGTLPPVGPCRRRPRSPGALDITEEVDAKFWLPAETLFNPCQTSVVRCAILRSDNEKREHNDSNSTLSNWNKLPNEC